MARVPKEVVGYFRSIPLFSSLPAKIVRSVAEAATPREFAAGDPVVREGETGRDLYVITRGSAIVTRRERRLMELSPGDFFGEMAFLSPAPRSATVTAYSDVRVLVLGPDALDALIDREPELARRLLAEMARRVQLNERSATV